MLKTGFNNNLDSHQIIHIYSKIIITLEYSENKKLHIKNMLKEMSYIFARLMFQYKFNYQTVFSARFDKQDEDDKVLDEVELYINLNTK